MSKSSSGAEASNISLYKNKGDLEQIDSTVLPVMQGGNFSTPLPPPTPSPFPSVMQILLTPVYPPLEQRLVNSWYSENIS